MNTPILYFGSKRVFVFDNNFLRFFFYTLFLGITDEDYVEEEGIQNPFLHQHQHQLQHQLQPSSLYQPEVDAEVDAEVEVEVEAETDEAMSDTDSVDTIYVHENSKIYKSQKYGSDNKIIEDSPTTEIEEIIENLQTRNNQDNENHDKDIENDESLEKDKNKDKNRNKNISRNQIKISSARRLLEDDNEIQEVEDDVEAEGEAEVEAENEAENEFKRPTTINNSSINQITNRMSRSVLTKLKQRSCSINI